MMMEEIKNDIYKLKRHQVDGPLSGFFRPIETVSLEQVIEIIDKYSDSDDGKDTKGECSEKPPIIDRNPPIIDRRGRTKQSIDINKEEEASESDETDGPEMFINVIQDYYKAQMRLIKVLMMKVEVEDEDEE